MSFSTTSSGCFSLSSLAVLYLSPLAGRGRPSVSEVG
jgi:hypothetical protein